MKRADVSVKQLIMNRGKTLKSGIGEILKNLIVQEKKRRYLLENIQFNRRRIVG